VEGVEGVEGARGGVRESHRRGEGDDMGGVAAEGRVEAVDYRSEQTPGSFEIPGNPGRNPPVAMERDDVSLWLCRWTQEGGSRG
jgi:hypothetical protein